MYAWVCLSPTLDDVAASPEEVAAESNVGRGHPVLGRDVAATASLDELAERGHTTGTSRGADRGCANAHDRGRRRG